MMRPFALPIIIIIIFFFPVTIIRTTSFKAGHTTGLIATHSNDIGNIRSASITWIPNTIMTLLYGENLFIEEVKIAQFMWHDSR